MDFKASPEDFGLTVEQGELLHVAYIEREMSMRAARVHVEKTLDCTLTETKVSRFINANGWKRPVSFHVRRSPWQGLNRAGVKESLSRRPKGR